MAGSRAHVGDASLIRRVRWRLVAWSAGSTFLLLLVLGIALYLSVHASLEGAGRAQLQQQADGVRHFVERLTHGFPAPDGDELSEGPEIGRPEFGGPGSGTISLVVDARGAFVGQQPIVSTDLPVMEAVTAALRDGSDVRQATVDGSPVRVLSEEIAFEGEPHVIQVIGDRTAEERTLGVLVLVLVGGGLVVLALAAVVGFLYAGNALVPIRDSLRRQREFAADASHELRTPLAVVRGNVEHLRAHADRPVGEMDEALADIEGEIDHVTRLVDDLLLLARSDSGAVELRRDAVDLADAAGEALQRLRSLADARHVTLSLDAAPAPLHGDADRLRQLVAILVDNAIRHSPHGGTVHVAVGGSPQPSVRVEDEGVGIGPADLPHLFDRFWRAADAPPGGTGLGLAIACWIVQHHGGQIRAANREGGGAAFEVRLARA